MRSNYFIPFLLLSLLVSVKAFAYDEYDYDEDAITYGEAIMVTIFGGIVLGVGFFLGTLKPLEGFGKGTMIVGAIIGGIGLINIAILILSQAISIAVSLALYAGALFVVGYILYSIYNWLFYPKS
jgi:hypothetical protein